MIVDETLGVGDEWFLKIFLARLKQFQGNGYSIIIVSNIIDALKYVSSKSMVGACNYSRNWYSNRYYLELPKGKIMTFVRTKIPDVIKISPKVFGDDRGFFLETYREDLFLEYGIGPRFVQDNQSGSKNGVLRGLHYQIKQAQGKLVRVIIGEVFDVAVDIRQDSETFGKWVGVILSEKNKQQLWLPPGLAHGFYVLSEWAEVVYKATEYYAPEYERSLLWNDSDLNIEWPIKFGATPQVSTKDMNAKKFQDAELYIKERI